MKGSVIETCEFVNGLVVKTVANGNNCCPRIFQNTGVEEEEVEESKVTGRFSGKYLTGGKRNIEVRVRVSRKWHHKNGLRSCSFL